MRSPRRRPGTSRPHSCPQVWTKGRRYGAGRTRWWPGRSPGCSVAVVPCSVRGPVGRNRPRERRELVPPGLAGACRGAPRDANNRTGRPTRRAADAMDASDDTTPESRTGMPVRDVVVTRCCRAVARRLLRSWGDRGLSGPVRAGPGCHRVIPGPCRPPARSGCRPAPERRRIGRTAHGGRGPAWPGFDRPPARSVPWGASVCPAALCCPCADASVRVPRGSWQPVLRGPVRGATGTVPTGRLLAVRRSCDQQ